MLINAPGSIDCVIATAAAAVEGTDSNGYVCGQWKRNSNNNHNQQQQRRRRLL